MKKTVLVTGSSRGIGRAIALKYAEHGYNVVINCARSTDRLEQVKKEAEALGAACLAVQADVGSWEDCVRLFARIQERFGDLDILVNNAGISWIGLLQDMDVLIGGTLYDLMDMPTCLNVSARRLNYYMGKDFYRHRQPYGVHISQGNLRIFRATLQYFDLTATMQPDMWRVL